MIVSTGDHHSLAMGSVARAVDDEAEGVNRRFWRVTKRAWSPRTKVLCLPIQNCTSGRADFGKGREIQLSKEADGIARRAEAFLKGGPLTRSVVLASVEAMMVMDLIGVA